MRKKPITWLVAVMLIAGSIAFLSLSMNGDHENQEVTITDELAYHWQGGKCGDGSSEKATEASAQEDAKHGEKCTCDECKGKDGKCKPNCKCPHHAKADKDGDGKVDKHEHKCGGGKCGGGKCGCGGKCGM